MHLSDTDKPEDVDWAAAVNTAMSETGVPSSLVNCVSKSGRVALFGGVTHAGWDSRAMIQQDLLAANNWIGERRALGRPVLFVPVGSQALLDGTGAHATYRSHHGVASTIMSGLRQGNTRIHWGSLAPGVMSAQCGLVRALVEFADLPNTRALVDYSDGVGVNEVWNLLKFPHTTGNKHKSRAKIKHLFDSLAGWMSGG